MPIIYKRRRRPRAGRKKREKKLRRLAELKTALSNLETSQPPRGSQFNPTTSFNDSNNHQLELSSKNSYFATSPEISERNLKIAGSISTQEIPIVDLVSDSEVDSEAETLIDFEACSQIQIKWVHSLHSWEETINTSTNRSVPRIGILKDRILHPSERVDLRQFF